MSFWTCAGMLVALGQGVIPPAPLVTVALDLREVAAMPSVQLEVLRDEASAIWRRYGVSLVWITDTSPADQWPGVKLTVERQPTERVGAHRSTTPPLGGIVFLERNLSAEPRILVSVGGVSELVESALRADRALVSLSPAIRHRLVGRALGRVLAHEVGHFLLAWRNHSTGGLMRPSFNRRDLIAADRAPFEISEFFVPRLRARLAQLAMVAATRSTP